MSESIFGDDQSSGSTQQQTQDASTETSTQPTTPVIPPELTELVGEGKKYKTVEDALKSLPHAQAHIASIEAENAALKADISKRASAAELLEDIRNQSQQTQQTTTQGVEISKDVVSDIVRQQLSIKAQEDLALANTSEVVSSFKKIHGEKSSEVFNKLAAENGMSVAQLENLAASSPKAVLKLAGLDKASSVPDTSLNSSVNTQSAFNTSQSTPSSRVQNYGNSKDILDGMLRAKAIVNSRLTQ